MVTEFGYAVAATDFDADKAERLLSLGADVNERYRDGRTPIFAAATVEAATFLISRGADVAARDGKGRTVIFTCHDETLLDFFLGAGLNINQQDNAGRTPAHEQKLIHQAPLSALVERGALLTIADKSGATPLHTCRAAAMLSTHPADLDWNVRDANGDVPLHYAVRAADSYWIHKLEALGAKAHRNNNGDLPLDTVVGQLTIGKRLPALVSRATLESLLFRGQVTWDFESVGFGVTDDDMPIEDPGPFEVWDFRLYSDPIEALNGRAFTDWSELFAEPLAVDTGREKHAALYRHEHEPVDNSIIRATDFSPTSCHFEWTGEREYFGDFHLQTKVDFLGFTVHPYDEFGRAANESADAFRAALAPHLPNFEERYDIVSVDETELRFRAIPKLSG